MKERGVKYQFTVETRFSGLVLMVQVYDELLQRWEDVRRAYPEDLPEFFRQLGKKETTV